MYVDLFRMDIILDCNGIYLLGKLNGVEYNRITKLNTTELRDTVYSIYVSQKDDIFLISSSGDVYKSTHDADVRFERIILFNQNDNIRKFCSGADFVCVLTGEWGDSYRVHRIDLCSYSPLIRKEIIFFR